MCVHPQSPPNNAIRSSRRRLRIVGGVALLRTQISRVCEELGFTRSSRRGLRFSLNRGTAGRRGFAAWEWQLQPAVTHLFSAIILCNRSRTEKLCRVGGFEFPRVLQDVGRYLQHCIWPYGAAASVSAVGRRLEERRSGGYAQLGAALGAAPEPRERKARQPRQPVPIASFLKVKKKKNNNKKNNKNTTATASALLPPRRGGGERKRCAPLQAGAYGMDAKILILLASYSWQLSRMVLRRCYRMPSE